MPQLIFNSRFNKDREQKYLIQKSIVTIGMDPHYDVYIQIPGSSGIIFTLLRQGDHFEILPGKVKLKINGQSISKTNSLSSCDRIEWNDGVAVFINSITQEVTEAQSAMRSLQMLQTLASAIQNPGAISWALHQTLEALIDLAG